MNPSRILWSRYLDSGRLGWTSMPPVASEIGVHKVPKSVLYLLKETCNPYIFIHTHKTSASWMWSELHYLLVLSVLWHSKDSAGSWCLLVRAEPTGLLLCRIYQSLGNFHALIYQNIFFLGGLFCPNMQEPICRKLTLMRPFGITTPTILIKVHFTVLSIYMITGTSLAL